MVTINIIDVLSSKGYQTVTTDYYNMIPAWESWYKGKVASFHSYTVYNGQRAINCERYSMGMGKKVAEDWANLLMNEKVKITLEGEKEQEFVDDVFAKNNFRIKCNEMQEQKAGLGAAAYVLRVDGAVINNDGVVEKADAIKLDYVVNGNILPLRWDNGNVIDCAFTTNVSVGKDKYIYLQIHRLTENGYDIENTIYKNNNGNLTEVPLGSVKGFENTVGIVHTGSNIKRFVIDRMNIANNVDPSIPLGIPAFANAIDQLKGIDIAYDSYVNEFVLGKKRIMVKLEALQNVEGEPAFDRNDVVFYALPEDASSDTFVKDIDMKLRTAEHNKGMQDMLNALSSKCGFGENHYKYENGNISTATQVISENSTLFRTIKKHEILLEAALIQLCRSILKLGNSYLNAGLKEDVEISVDFDDSIIEDKETDFNRDARMVSMGIMNSWEFRAKWMNEDEETAKAALPGVKELVSDVQ